ncbi:MAG: hypothetical protein ACOC1K_03345 [Nanoarchaeota archaeon]
MLNKEDKIYIMILSYLLVFGISGGFIVYKMLELGVALTTDLGMQFLLMFFLSLIILGIYIASIDINN